MATGNDAHATSLRHSAVASPQHVKLSQAHRSAIIAGFRAATAAGPLIGDMVHGVGVKLIFADIEHSNHISNVRDAIVLSTTRNAVRQSLLGARPRLLEPVYEIEVLTIAECVEQIR
uniref:U5 small nuclear ribonucleoprotein component n=1 Tax=Lygus hesperus TaxID=30085 RepID=A0A0A9Y125_LYGHE